MKYSDSYLRRARLVSGLVTFGGCTIPEITQATGQSCLAIPPWVDAMSTGDSFEHHWGRNGRVLRNSWACFHTACWHTGYWLKSDKLLTEPAIRPTLVVF